MTRWGAMKRLAACFLYQVAYRGPVPDINEETRDPSFSAFALRRAVHVDALRRSPREYLRSVWWRIMGKKLRARMLLAPLLGASSRAYDLWRAQQRFYPQNKTAETEMGPTLHAIIRDGAKIGSTLASCQSEGLYASVISAPQDLTDLDLGDDEWVLPLSAGDTLARGAHARYRAAAISSDPNTHVIYADDDLIDSKGRLTNPHLKPGWNGELFEHLDYLTGSALIQSGALGDLNQLEADWAETLTRRAIAETAKKGGEPMHIPCVLHHRRARLRAKPLEALPAVKQPLPCVTIIIPTRNRVDLLRECLEGLRRTHYPDDLDILVIDNGSDDLETLDYLAGLEAGFARVLRDDSPFNFAALNNRAAKIAQGDLLCFLNNDIEVRDPNWLKVMAAQAVRQEVGAVGAQLLYPDGRIQHAGVVLGIGGAAAHAHRTVHPDAEGYFHRHALPQFVSAVTAACMVVSREKFEAVGGFDENRFPVSFNDVDLCLRLAEQGWRSLYEPRASLVHHESVSRGFDRDAKGAARQAQEVAALQAKWQTGLASANNIAKGIDPFHHPGLSRLSELFVLNL